jgi:hypothetical protein
MLPDFPDIRRQIARIQQAIMKVELDRKTPLLRKVRQLVQQEGNENENGREDGSMIKDPYHEFKAPIELKIAEIGTVSLTAFAGRIQAAIDDLARQSMAHLFQTLDQVTGEVGNSVDAGGRPWTPELLLELMEKIDMSFDDNGKPEITIVMHPDLFQSIQERYPTFDESPEFKKRYDDIVRRKREAWLDRENNRKLVG